MFRHICVKLNRKKVHLGGMSPHVPSLVLWAQRLIDLVVKVWNRFSYSPNNGEIFLNRQQLVQEICFLGVEFPVSSIALHLLQHLGVVWRLQEHLGGCAKALGLCFLLLTFRGGSSVRCL